MNKRDMRKIDWITSWDVVSLKTISDGNCLFHALLNAYSDSYRDAKDDSEKIILVLDVRKKLSLALSSINPSSNGSDRMVRKTYYDTLNGGNTELFSKAVPDFSIESMTKQLCSSNPIGYGFMEYIGLLLNKDIYILDSNTKDIYHSDELVHQISGSRSSVVLLYENGHYELTGIFCGSCVHTIFPPDHPWIVRLYNKVQNYIYK